MTNSIDTDMLGNLGLLRQRQPSGPADELGQEQFLELMIAQLRNQDPFKPMESGEFLGQLAQFGTVSGIEDVRGALADLTHAMSANQTMQAAGLVDRQAYVAAREAWLPPGGSVRGAAVVPEGTTGANLSIYDMNGRLVASRVYDMRAADPLILLTAAVIVAAVALLATMIPAVRASRLDAARALRPE